MEKYVLSVLVENKTGVLSRVSGLFSRRGYNIDSLTVCATDKPEQSRMTIVVTGDEYILDQIQKQLAKLEEVIAIKKCESKTSVQTTCVTLCVRSTSRTWRSNLTTTPPAFTTLILSRNLKQWETS